MSQNKIQLYDDNVLKLTIKQGTEQERFNINQNIGSAGTTYYGSNNEEINILDPLSISTVPGSFSSGELAYTRDTGRVFVGSLTNESAPVNQITFGGTLVGNKYLGAIDSKRVYNKTYGDEDDNINNGTPLNLSTRTGNSEKGVEGLLLENSLYRSYNFLANDSNTPQTTSDGKWARLSFYNPKYDAYDGDFMYDIYRNALILFDHNIKPSTENYPNQPSANSSKVGGKRKTPLQPRVLKDGTTSEALKTVKKHTEDMYGDGYVLLYNVIPDGETLTFADRQFDKDTGACSSTNDTLATNFSYNVIKLNKVPVNVLKEALDPEFFIIPEDGATTKISLNTSKVNSSFTIDDSNCPNNAILTYDKERKTIVPVAYTLTKTGQTAINVDAIEKLTDWGTEIKTVKEYVDSKFEDSFFDPSGEFMTKVVNEVVKQIGPGSSDPSETPATVEVVQLANSLKDTTSSAVDDLTNLLALITTLHTTTTAGIPVVDSQIKKYFPDGITATKATITATEETLNASLEDIDETLNGVYAGEETWTDDDGTHTEVVTTGGIDQDIENMIALLRTLHPEANDQIDTIGNGRFTGRGMENEE